MTAALNIEPTGGPLGAFVRGLDLSRELDEATLLTIRLGLRDHLLLAFRGHAQPSDDELLRFGSALGELGEFTMIRPGYPNIVVISHLVEDGRKLGSTSAGELPWHTDKLGGRPRALQLLEALELPRGGSATYWTDTYTAFERRPRAERELLSGLQVDHRGQGEAGDLHSVHPLVMTNPDSGRRALFLTHLSTMRAVGLPAADSDALLRRLFGLATTPDLVYRHSWQLGDLVVWDAIGTMHRRDAYDGSARRYLRGMCTLLEETAP